MKVNKVLENMLEDMHSVVAGSYTVMEFVWVSN